MQIRLSDLSKMSRAAKVFLISEITFGFATGLLSVHQNFFYRSIGLNSLVIGAISMEGAIATAATALLAGAFANRRGYYPVCLLGSLMQGAGLFVMAFFGAEWSAHAGYIVYAVGLTFIHAVEFPYLINMAREEHRSSAYFYLILIFSLSSIAGNLAGQWVLNLGPGTMAPYRLSIFISAAGFVALSVLRLRLKNIRPVVHQKKGSVLALALSAIVRGYLMYHVLMAMAMSLLYSQLNIIYREVFGFSDVLVSQIYSASTFLTLLALIVLPGVIRRFSANRVSLVILFTSLGIFILSAFVGPVLFVALVLLRGALSQVFPVVIESRMLSSLIEEQQAGYTSFRVLAVSIGQGIGASMTGYFLTFSDFRVLMLMGAMLLAGTIGIYFFMIRKRLAVETASKPGRLGKEAAQ